ncbi:Ubiquitin carboxyl-terminal hydrolase 14 [Halotydeus destructor]|nr:Ubiquitin carboxyl-terminal hydrolase 14 [Halotydeus destructor]
MPVFKVKWGAQNYPDLDLDTDEEPTLFKAQLFALTGVQPDRQKVMCKGKVLGDSTWEGLQVKDGAQLLMMGTADPLPAEPVEKVVFMEDMDPNELASALELPAGLTNLGNTCYLNATVQCLRTVPELRDALARYIGSLSLSGAGSEASNLTVALRDLYKAMDDSAVITPFILIQVLHSIFPRFAEKSEHGGFQQQDANECWTELMRILQQKLEATQSAGSASASASFIDQYFGGTFEVKMKNSESEDEPVKETTENFLQLSCFISQDVKYMQSGLKLRLEETIEKKSDILGRNCKYTKISKIKRLPAYLTVQFVRFFYKGQQSVSAKIMKDIKFTLSLDVFELCTEELQEKLLPMRKVFKEIEDKKATEGTPSSKALAGDNSSSSLLAASRQSFSFDGDQGSNNSGLYELQAVLTHKGRSSNSGHYVSWVRRNKDEWFKCDDDTVSTVTTEEILKLSGGGDWHTAYVLLYGPKILEETSDRPATTSSV